MHKVKIENISARRMTVSVEPNPSFYDLMPGQALALCGQFEEEDGHILLQYGFEEHTPTIVIFCTEGEYTARRDGSSISPDNSRV